MLNNETNVELPRFNDFNEMEVSLFNILVSPVLKNEDTRSYINTFSSLRYIDLGNNNTVQQDLELPDDEASRSPCPSDEQDESICIVSSGEDSNHAYNDENEDEYTDSEDMDDMENSNGMLENEEAEDDEISDPLRIYNEDNEIEYEQDMFDRASDDFILNNRLRHHHKERSLSLQDLNISKHNLHSPQKKKWHNYLNLKLNKNTFREAYSAMYKRQIMSHKNDYMDNKMMNYLRDVREQNKNVRDEYMKEQELMINKSKGNEGNNIQQVRTKLRNQATENCAEEINNDLQQEEIVDSNLNPNASQIFGNKTSNGIIEQQYEHIQEATEYSNTYNVKHVQNCDNNIGKRNGSLDVNAHMNCNNVETDAQTIENCDASVSKIMSIKNVVASDEPENVNSAKNKAVDRLNAEIAELNTQIRQFHQKAATEDIKMKQELDSLKKSLAKYEGKSKVCETKGTLQTEIIANASNKDTVTSEERKNIISISNVESAVITADDWPEATYVPVRSTESSEINLNRTSSNGDTLKKTVNSVLRTCIMSSPYSETFSNVTQGKTRIENPSVGSIKKELNGNIMEDQSQDHSLHMNSAIGASNSKKRKAVEMLDDSSFAQVSKISHTEKNNIIDAADVEFKYPEMHTNSKIKQEISNGSINRNRNGSIPVQSTMEHIDDNEDNVKCFIYRDDNNSKNRSFLIQTEEPVKDSGSEKHRIEECGPYLLGNLEIRMSKINGVISVWGKEVDNESKSDSEDDMEISVKPSTKNTCCCQNTWQNRFNGGSSIHSPSKKQRIPSKFNRSSHCNLSLKSSTFINDMNDQRDKQCFGPTTSCGNCTSSHCHKYEWATCKDVADSQKQVHSSCVYHTEPIDQTCDCSSYHEKLAFDVNSKCCRDTFHSVGVQRHGCKNVCTAKSSLNNTWDNSNQNVSYEDEEVPSIPHRRANETAEMRQRRLRRKRVEGVIKGLLDEYGDCHDNSVANENRSETQNSSHIVNDPPETKIPPKSESVCSMSIRSDNRCCHGHRRSLVRIEELQMGMVRIESQLNTIVKMLNKLHYVDRN
ncbi:uncharacterized protein LOC108633082 isoform X2 [Ceratina calcarata]|uniref:Uncharacterized protein LOC108633082 isoform X2 n=1 Tax=Ceratina calcarata TaxID=156304 RepID=A0AAJ7RVW2_9HYME|nr:uncharacterized protein LOC108633082 isoform X2 [Ceratina calcarata]